MGKLEKNLSPKRMDCVAGTRKYSFTVNFHHAVEKRQRTAKIQKSKSAYIGKCTLEKWQLLTLKMRDLMYKVDKISRSARIKLIVTSVVKKNKLGKTKTIVDNLENNIRALLLGR